MARRKKVAKPWHILATGYLASDYKGIAAGDAYLSGDLTEDDITGFDTREKAEQHPAAVAWKAEQERQSNLGLVEHQKSPEAYSAKYEQAAAYLRLDSKPLDSELDTRLWKYLVDCMRIEGLTAEQAANAIVDAHNSSTAQIEAERTQLKVDTQ